MADKEKMRTLVEKAYAARDGGDVDAAVAAWHPDGSFSLAGDQKALPLTGTAHGHADIRETMGALIASFEFVSRDILKFIADGDHAAVNSRLTVRFVPKNNIFTTEVLDVFEFRDDKIISFVEFADTALIRDLNSA